ncbi:MAG: 4Fe-4S dicluster domain-containing protein [Candidatus Altiarchaeota archaeon]
MAKILHKRNLHEYLRELAGKYSVYAPVLEGDTVFFRRMTGMTTVRLDYDTTSTSIKSVFFKPGEALLDYNGQDAVVPAHEEETIVFGLHLYDVQALQILDEAFKKPYEDEYYLRRRENSVIVAVEHDKVPNSFYGELGLELNEGYDLLLTDEGEYYSIIVGSREGEKILKSEFIADGPEGKSMKSEDKCKPLDVNRIMNFLDKGPEHGLWHKLAKDCFACGACAYVCPICHCFDVKDSLDFKGESGERRREWDSCMLADFSAVAGGGNFRGKRHERIHNWYHHKFSRAVKERGKPDCVGCGRCITACPAKIDIHGILKKCEELG